MAKKRSANRGWRNRMEQHLADNPEKQAQVDALVKERYSKQLASLLEAQVSITEQIAFLEGEISTLSGNEATPEATS